MLLGSSSLTFAGTWSDHFLGNVLGANWQGDRDYVLEVSPDITAPDAWTLVTNSPTVSGGGQFTIILEPAPGSQFYRLVPRSP